MQVPLEITFHNMQSSDWAEQEIRARVQDLESIYDRLVSCRVRVDHRATNSSDTIPAGGADRDGHSRPQGSGGGA